MEDTIRILAISGSLRAVSSNTALLRAAAEEGSLTGAIESDRSIRATV